MIKGLYTRKVSLEERKGLIEFQFPGVVPVKGRIAGGFSHRTEMPQFFSPEGTM